jgi:plasmid stabilization system protein ParE
MEYAIVWTEPASVDLERILARLAMHSPAGAETVRTALLEHVELLRRFPEIGPVYERDRSGRTREIVYRGYRIFYQVNEPEHRVEILTVWQGSRRHPRLLNGGTGGGA